MLLHSESSVLAAVECPEVRNRRLMSLRRVRDLLRVVGLLVLIAALGLWSVSRGISLVTGMVFLGCLDLSARTTAQIQLLLALDGLEAMVARRPVGSDSE
ncbi:MAG: hypothetical protein ABFS86_15195 [Planctomycetota bacterium]